MSSDPAVAGVATTGFMAPSGSKRGARKRPVARLLPGFVTGLIAVLLVPAPATAIDEFPVPPGTNPGGITAGPDGALWFIEEGTSQIGRITTTGAVTNHYPVTTGPRSSVSPLDQITLGPDGALWFTQPRDNQIGRITTAGGAPTEFALPVSDGEPEGITAGPDGALWFTAANAGKIGRIPSSPPADRPHGITLYPRTGRAGSGLSDISVGPDGALWFTEETGNRIGRITTGGVISHFRVPTASSEPSGITQGPGGGLWFVESAANQIARITTEGAITEYPGAGAEPSAIAVGRDGALWFTESHPSANAIGRITTGGDITNHFRVPTARSEPSDITTGPDGALWFTEFLGNKIGRIETATPFAPPSSQVLPSGKKKAGCKVPNVRGLSRQKAKKRLKRARCKYRIRGKGRIVSTSPKAGKRTTKIVKVRAKPRKRTGRGAKE
jgi:virginiamycin B lyase